jgi:hypothetical protein
MTEQPTITQADRDAAAAYWKASMIGSSMTQKLYKSGEFDSSLIVQAFARHRTTSLAAQDVEPSSLRESWSTCLGMDVSEWAHDNVPDMLDAIEQQAKEIASLRNYITTAPPAASLAAQDGLVEALEKVRKCALVVPSIFPDRPPSVSWIVSELTKILPEMDAALTAIKEQHHD